MKISIIGRSVLKPINESEDIKVSQLFGADKIIIPGVSVAILGFQFL